MTKSELNDPYFEWMYRLVVDDRYSNKSYRRLFYKLHDTEFAYTIPMDGNRAEDGIDLRYRFGREQGYRDAVIANCLDIRPCSILEMMIALAIRCEEHIMEDPDIGRPDRAVVLEYAGQFRPWFHGCSGLILLLVDEARPFYGS